MCLRVLDCSGSDGLSYSGRDAQFGVFFHLILNIHSFRTFFFCLEWGIEREIAFLGKVEVLNKFSFCSKENLHVFIYFRNQSRIIGFITIMSVSIVTIPRKVWLVLEVLTFQWIFHGFECLTPAYNYEIAL